jgi:hypothetical protein
MEIKEFLKTAEFKIMTPDRANRAEIVDTYYLSFNSYKELHGLIQEAREVWDEYIVEVRTDLCIQTFSHTFKEELAMD